MTDVHVEKKQTAAADVVKSVEKELESCKTKARRRVLVPDYRVFLREDGHELKAYLPGVGSEDVSLELEGRYLKIRGKLKDLAWEGFTRTHVEFAMGDYEADFKIPEGINRDRVTGVLKNGILTVTLPKAEEELPKSIQVTVAQA